MSIISGRNIDHFLIDIEKTFHRSRAPMATLRLAAYAAYAMRVLHKFQQHADMSPDLDRTLKSVCPDWRNPGSTIDPADLIAVALFYAISTLEEGEIEIERLIQNARSDRHASSSVMMGRRVLWPPKEG